MQRDNTKKVFYLQKQHNVEFTNINVIEAKLCEERSRWKLEIILFSVDWAEVTIACNSTWHIEVKRMPEIFSWTLCNLTPMVLFWPAELGFLLNLSSTRIKRHNFSGSIKGSQLSTNSPYFWKYCLYSQAMLQLEKIRMTHFWVITEVAFFCTQGNGRTGIPHYRCLIGQY